MYINFHTTKKDATEFKIKNDRITFSGIYKKKNRFFIDIDAKIEGILSCTCDICADGFDKRVDESVHFLVHDGIYSGHNELDELDIIESNNSRVELDELLESELESVKNDYNYCIDCINKDTLGE